MIAAVLPDGASIERTTAALGQASEIARATPGVENVIAISGQSVLDNNATLANAGVEYVIFKSYAEREKAKGQDLDLDPRTHPGQAQQPARRARHRAGAAAHSGHRPGRRLPDGGRTARRQLQLYEARRADPADRQIRQRRSASAARADDLPSERAACRRHGGPRPRRDAESLGRRRLLDALGLSRLDLHQPVQQIRPVVPGLCAGRFPVPAAAGGHPQSLCAQFGSSRWCRSARSPI